MKIHITFTLFVLDSVNKQPVFENMVVSGYTDIPDGIEGEEERFCAAGDWMIKEIRKKVISLPGGDYVYINRGEYQLSLKDISIQPTN